MTPKDEFSLGVDLAQRSFQVALAPIGADPEHWRDLANTSIGYPPDSSEGIERLTAWVQRQGLGGRCRFVVVESTGKISVRFARALAGGPWPEPSIVNPRRTKAWADSLGVNEKSDRNDAAMLALYGLARRPRPTTPLGRTEAQLRELSRLRQSYSETLTAWRNRLAETEGAEARELIEGTIEELSGKIEKIELTCEQRVEQDATLGFQYRALQQIKGIKRITALTLTAEFGDLRGYRRNQLVARAGLYPKHYSSGSSVWRAPRLARGGGGRVRRVLYMGATSLFCSKGAMREWIELRRARGMDKAKILGALMRKLLLIARALMINNGRYEESKIGVRSEKILA